ncbi:MAG TPA: class I SAM-dependent methyltransferase [Tahibacter sp.]|uniref:class I SAM-dependent methyltransferase n=1 Tax=Tahibacter sp. TaxID=2056211 RepID=UPI002CB4FDE6|nr:class I SAM-dependent methyltransferase [Tahibacter sp.]HSX58675.1 class I SAM-dependent methyltransferase [Tahibacter sp.]
MSAGTALEFTGERFTPECVREIWYEHWHRYALVRAWAGGKRVLDAACGEGYGSALLAQVAGSVLGLDVDPAAVAHARARYADTANLHFDEADATRLSLPAGGFDLVVSFETLEHVEAQDALLDGLCHALADDGLLVISSPDKATYSDAAGFRNEYHVRELYRDEFEALLRRRFGHVRLYAQRLLFQSAIWTIDPPSLDAPGQYATAGDDGSVESGLGYAPMYYIAVCSRNPLPDLPAASWFGDRDESLYRHYNHEIRKNMAAGARIAELEAQLEAALQRERAAADALKRAAEAVRRPWWRRWGGGAD